jgi:alanine dehydrogenase
MAARGARGLDAHVLGIDADLDRLYHARLQALVDAAVVSFPVHGLPRRWPAPTS